MNSSLIPTDELRFLLRWLQPAPVDGEAETIEAVLQLAGQLASDFFLPHYKEADQIEPRLEDGNVLILPPIIEALKAYAEAGFFAAGFDESLGGLGFSNLLASAAFAQFAAANIATAAYPMLTAANARLITTFGNAGQIEQFALPLIAGRWFGTMCLSEPQAGSSLADIRTRALYVGEDEFGPRYRLIGNKMWISGGDQNASENIVHLVLAKIPGEDGTLPAGTEGISLFIVPKVLPSGDRNDVVVAGLNHKMGYRGTANCLLNFGETVGASGWLVGEPGRGLAQMFQMMNEARICVGIGAAALAVRAYRLSLQYASERHQGRLPGVRSGAPVPIIQHQDVRRMLLSQKAYAEGALALCLHCASLVDSSDEEAEALLAVLTPIAKTWSAEYGLEANDMAIQIHGGYGYTRDFDVEQLYRDNRLNPIHEGTTAIQGADLLGRKILRDNLPFEILTQKVKHCIRRVSTDPEIGGCAQALAACWSEIEASIETFKKRDRDLAMMGSTQFLWSFGHAVMAWIWLELAVEANRACEAGEISQDFAGGKVKACRFYFEYELPKTTAWLKIATECSGVTMDISPTEF